MRSLVLLAPTGRASKRMNEQSGFPSYTIHRFLKWQKESNTFFINEENKSDAKIVIIDENGTYVNYNNLTDYYGTINGLNPYCKPYIIWYVNPTE
jgi:ATP-dependent exoDNAse (exonuclease V) alpha subunit